MPASPFKTGTTVTWLNVDGLHDAELMGKIRQLLFAASLVLEDVLSTDQRPKYEDYDEYLYIVVRMLRYDADVMKAKAEQCQHHPVPEYVLTFQEGFAGDVFEAVRTRLREDKGVSGKWAPIISPTRCSIRLWTTISSCLINRRTD